MRVTRLHPFKRSLGTHVVSFPSSEPFPHRVVGPNGAVLTAHHSLAAACARCRWHVGTRFVFVEFAGVNEGACWDGLQGRLVDWDVALAAMGETCSDNTRARQGLSSAPTRTNVVAFRRASIAP